MIHTRSLALDRQKTLWPASDNIWSQRYATTNEPVSHLDRQILLRKAVYYSHFKKHDIPKHTVKDRQKILSFKRYEQVPHNPVPGLSAFQIVAAKPGHVLCQRQRRWTLLLFLILANILGSFAWNSSALAPSASTPLPGTCIRTGWAWLHPWTVFLKACPFLSLIHLSAPGCCWGLQFTCSFVLFSQTPNCPEVSF